MDKSRVYLLLGVSFFLAFSLVAPARAKITDGLVAYWPLDDGSGLVARDWSGKGHNGTLTASGIDWVAGKVNGAVDCHGAD